LVPEFLRRVEKVLPTLEVPPLQCVQHAGEVVYVPTGWWHGILNLCDSVGVAFEVGIERSVLLTT
jgi:ribosomal protein L16 Arg81 hydroxylase